MEEIWSQQILCESSDTLHWIGKNENTTYFVCLTVSRRVANGFVYSTYWLISYYLSERHSGYFTAKGESATVGTDEIDLLNIQTAVQFWVW